MLSRFRRSFKSVRFYGITNLMAPTKLSKVYAFTLTQKEFSWHNEDSFLASRRFPIYAVADGVTMPALHELLVPSESKLAADKFCKKSIEFLEKHFKALSPKTIKSAYECAGMEMKKLNAGRRHKLSATAALAAVKNGEIFGSRVCDCGFAVIRKGGILFKTPEFWSHLKSTGKKRYGTINGDAISLKYIDMYRLKYKSGDILALFTDGFENHFENREFVYLFADKHFENIKNKIKKFDAKLVNRGAEKFGHERTLLVAKLN